MPPDVNLEAAIKAEQAVWNVLPEIKKTQHLNIVQMYQMAGIERNLALLDPKVETPVPLPKKATPIPAWHSQLRVSISAAASLPSLPPKSPSVVKSTPAPDDNKKKPGKMPKNELSEELLALAAKAKPDLLPMVLQSHMLRALDGTTKATQTSAEFNVLLNLDHLCGDHLSIMDICLSPVWPVLYFMKVKGFKNINLPSPTQESHSLRHVQLQ
ncbi:hypothetical protein DACRYDRAFT_107161 [Dacryopinax primogenitus]|uniref:Uncharacterized protein n=1 Tax=Dacryopinax primogenitus (strain DJM 731) TaxID=1858805 RepID=M5G8Q7_DACPD|nr:uncharacterized protein DACRYDRAFT_107161 [Dacryopinax primogenitus]EJU02227.1 hypothetical protein DACRYDRAFT_107161 [Dacryopinax primogenitus]